MLVIPSTIHPPICQPSVPENLSEIPTSNCVSSLIGTCKSQGAIPRIWKSSCSLEVKPFKSTYGGYNWLSVQGPRENKMSLQWKPEELGLELKLGMAASERSRSRITSQKSFWTAVSGSTEHRRHRRRCLPSLALSAALTEGGPWAGMSCGDDTVPLTRFPLSSY